ncbi:UDP-N-acetylmuramate--alanine ligase [Gammaproteobacteria bacterium]|nr:UDP-N-acetylmuramate:L-alanyl-gamma-D-glutamyl-meso-diaminopimelate ligase [Gammaproteobacteria bacterium]CAG0940808.1 UDP-N-acetylmuramate--alanine ligase [Gammaproteobacteria bacterium]
MHVHILGICGTFMAGVAAIAREAGHRVTGSDRGVYPPMSDQLAALGIAVTEGYAAGQLTPRPDMVVVGNVMTRGMPVVEELLDSGIPYSSGPEWLAREVLRTRHVIAISGTHGKTTTTSLAAWILSEAGQEPGFLIGGVTPDLGVSARLGRGPAFVIEADEYDTAFFDKGAKFLHYRPRTLVINNLEYDHADIYPDLAAIQRQFHQLVRTVPGSGTIIHRAQDANVAEVLARGCWTPLETFSSQAGVDAGWTGIADDTGFRLQRRGAPQGATAWSLAGDHNAENATAAILAARAAGVDIATALAAVGRFRGVRRRLELLGRWGGVSLYDDFAHHPTAITRTLSAVRRSLRPQRVLVVTEPRSNTMKLGAQRAELAPALALADQSWVLEPEGLSWDLAEALAPTPTARLCRDTAGIVAAVTAEARAGDAIVIMSNGGFQGIRAALAAALAARFVAD